MSRRLLVLATAAADTLETTMREGPPAVRVRAADVVLGRLLQVREVAVLEARLAALEAAIGLASEPAGGLPERRALPAPRPDAAAERWP